MTKIVNDECVTKEDCRMNSRNRNWQISSLFAMVSILVVLSGWSIVSGNTAINTAIDTQSQLKVYEARADQVDKNLSEVITDLKLEIIKLNKNIDDLRDKLWNQKVK